MKLIITKDSSADAIQHEFNINYPFLKIEFLKNGQAQTASFFNIKKFLSESLYQKSISVEKKEIDIDGHRTVAELMIDFEKIIGFAIKLFRKSGGVWVEASLTDDWTLEEQNSRGKQINNHFDQEIKNLL